MEGYTKGFPLQGKRRGNSRKGASTVMGQRFADKVMPKKTLNQEDPE
jgi:hypothetical protein